MGNKDLTTTEELTEEFWGPVGTPKRDELERELENFRIGLTILQAREDQQITQAQLAERIGKKREYISRVENDANNITLRSLRKIVEQGLGGKLRIEIDFDHDVEKPKSTGVKKRTNLAPEQV